MRPQVTFVTSFPFGSVRFSTRSGMPAARQALHQALSNRRIAVPVFFVKIRASEHAVKLLALEEPAAHVLFL